MAFSDKPDTNFSRQLSVHWAKNFNPRRTTDSRAKTKIDGKKNVLTRETQKRLLKISVSKSLKTQL